MTNNDILRRLRYTFDWPNAKVVGLFKQGGASVVVDDVLAWLKRDDDEGYKSLPDETFARFLNGLIEFKRGAKDGEPMPVEKTLNNNIVLRKLKIAFNLNADQILSLLNDANFRLGKAELSAFFRKPEHKHYRICKDQVLRNFLVALQKQHRP